MVVRRPASACERPAFAPTIDRLVITTALRRLSPDDAPALAQLLDEEPLQNVYLRSEVRLAGLGNGQWWGVDGHGRLKAALLGGPLVVPWVPDADDVDRLAEALGRQQSPRMIVGPREQVLALHQARHPAPPLKELRDPQPLLALRRGKLHTPPAEQVRKGIPRDLDRLTVAAADMHREEMGVDPLAIDPSGWRTRMSTLIQRGWSWVWTEGDEVVFKAELSAWTPEAVQVQGVYTAPRVRNRGVATAAMAAVCAAVLDDVPVCTLYVNHYNGAARKVYDRLGFEQVGSLATLMY
jgi:RimJ/RimL family protein N-acetyltransferase